MPRKNGRKNRSNGSSNSISQIYQTAASWGTYVADGNKQDLVDEMTKLPKESSIGGANSQLSALKQKGMRRGKVYARHDGSACIIFDDKDGKEIGFAHVQTKGGLITEAKFGMF